MSNMVILRRLLDNSALALPMITLVTVAVTQWFLIPSLDFYLVFDKMVLFFWLIYRPDRVSIFWLTLLYLAPDLKEGLALGFSSLMTLLFTWFVLLQRHVLLRQTFMLQWVVLGVLLTLHFLVLYVTYSFLASHSLSLLPLVISGTLAVASYPVLVRVLTKLQRLVPIDVAWED
jgi:cell shape-determining protein MreD